MKKNIPSPADEKEMNIVIVGHVDHGKSTVIGRLLADTGSLPEGKLDFVRELCRRTSKPFEYAFLLDALKDERSQGITIDTARCFFHTEKRRYIIIDAPGHIEFLKNMITGASRAEAALLVIDANEGICENSRRHGYMLSMLGIKQVAVLVNKLDLIPSDERHATYEKIVAEYSEFLKQTNLEPMCFIPVSATEGWNIAEKSGDIPWYNGKTVLEALDSFEDVQLPESLPLRMWVQDVYKFTNDNDSRRIIAGTVSSGTLHSGDSIMLMPSGKKTTVSSIEVFNAPAEASVSAGKATGFCMTEQIYARRGELVTVIGQTPPSISSRVEASLFWLGKNDLTVNKEYKLKLGSAQAVCSIDEIIGVMDASSLETVTRQSVRRHEVAKCVIHFDKPLPFDTAGQIADTSRFVIVDDYEISGGGIITRALGDELMESGLQRRDIKWIHSSITAEQRETYYKQKAELIIITGEKATDKKNLARSIEKKLLDDGKIAYYLGMGNLLYGVNADIKSDDSMYVEQERREHIRRLGELANIMLKAGNILVVSISELTSDELDTLKRIVSTDNITSVWIGSSSAVRRDFDMYFDDAATAQRALLEQPPV